jgi:hypothetical protein
VHGPSRCAGVLAKPFAPRTAAHLDMVHGFHRGPAMVSAAHLDEATCQGSVSTGIFTARAWGRSGGVVEANWK